MNQIEEEPQTTKNDYECFGIFIYVKYKKEKKDLKEKFIQ